MNEIKFRVKFEELSSELVFPLLDLLEGNIKEVDKIFVWCFQQDPINEETRMSEINYFFEINNQIIQYNLEDVFENKITFSDDEDTYTRDSIGSTFEDLISLFKKYSKDVPSEIKVICIPKTEKVEFKLNYIERKPHYIDATETFLLPWIRRVRESSKENRWVF